MALMMVRKLSENVLTTNLLSVNNLITCTFRKETSKAREYEYGSFSEVKREKEKQW